MTLRNFPDVFSRVDESIYVMVRIVVGAIPPSDRTLKETYRSHCLSNGLLDSVRSFLHTHHLRSCVAHFCLNQTVSKSAFRLCIFQLKGLSQERTYPG